MSVLSTQEQSHHSALSSFTDLDAKIAVALGKDHARFLRYREEWKLGAVDRAYPLQLDFALSDSCNMRCPMCTWSEDHGLHDKSLFSLELFRHIVTEGVPLGLCGVGLNGVNEPLMRRDLPTFVAVARAAGVMDVMLHTNGMLLTETMAAGLIETGLTRLMVSIDAVTQATYDTIRVGGDLAIVERNIDRFLALRGGAILPVLGVCFVRMSLNAHEEVAFIEHWRGRADFFSFQSYMNPFLGHRPDKAALAPDGTSAPQTAPPCPQPFQRLRISVGGEVHPCCAFHGDQIVVERVSEPRHDIKSIWNGGTMNRLREIHATGSLWGPPSPRGDAVQYPAEVCRTCIRQSYTRGHA
jgi:hypothetical protein